MNRTREARQVRSGIARAELAPQTTPPVLIPPQGQFDIGLCEVAEDDQHANLLEPLPHL